MNQEFEDQQEFDDQEEFPDKESNFDALSQKSSLSRKSSISQKSSLSTRNSLGPVFFPSSLNKVLEIIDSLMTQVSNSSISQQEILTLYSILKNMKADINYAKFKNVSVDELYSKCSHEWNDFADEVTKLVEFDDLDFQVEFCQTQVKELASIVEKIRPAYQKYTNRNISTILKEIGDDSNDEEILDKIENKMKDLQTKINSITNSSQNEETETNQNQTSENETNNDQLEQNEEETNNEQLEQNENEQNEEETNNEQNENEEETNNEQPEQNENEQNEEETNNEQLKQNENEEETNNEQLEQNEEDTNNEQNENENCDIETKKLKYKSFKVSLKAFQRLLSKPISHSKIPQIEEAKNECKAKIDLMKECFINSQEAQAARQSLQVYSYESMKEIRNAFKKAQKEETEMLSKKFINDKDESHGAAQRATGDPNHDKTKKTKKATYPKKKLEVKPLPSHTKVTRSRLYDKSNDKQSIAPKLNLRPRKSKM